MCKLIGAALGLACLGGCMSMNQEEGVYAVDSLKNVRAYATLGKNFPKVVEFLSRADLAKLPNGRYAIDGKNAYAIVQESTLREWGAGKPEVHHEYFDIQLPLSGAETIGIARFDPATPGEFDESKDIGFYDVAVEPVKLRPGEFAILHPETCAHVPCCSDDCAGEVIRKIVVKVRK